MAKKEKIIVGMSGGVDSSVAALLMIEQGYQVEGLFMKNWEEDDSREYCSAAVDLADAQSVADQLGIRLHTINFSGEYWDHVFEHFLAEYRAGRTPNPDVLCNREIKFKAFLDYALHLGAAGIATGHYASIGRREDSWQMLRARDENKDQTYFLYMLGQEQLRHSHFPLGDLEKPEVRKIAEQAGLPNHKKKDSTGICFIGERKFSEFLSRYLPARPGQMVTPEGSVIGEHQGLMYYTLGQRKGLGIGGRADSETDPWFVVDKDLESNRLIVAQGHDHPLLLKQELDASQLHWVAGSAPPLPVTCMARIRHRQPLQACTLSPLENGHLRVQFNKKQRAVTPGQSIVFYQDQVCLGGGIIEQAY
ncbi:tRNA 2-thiouridine(34) synthase MnmA [Sedimenticola selenatireducens]|uniref:tRNA 2-thiouridine(34) synthase MnmA n=1 Tax=Sedimenticola selenatireducens TaxID=191960 RepID=UPI003F4A97F6